MSKKEVFASTFAVELREGWAEKCSSVPHKGSRSDKKEWPSSPRSKTMFCIIGEITLITFSRQNIYLENGPTLTWEDIKWP